MIIQFFKKLIVELWNKLFKPKYKVIVINGYISHCGLAFGTFSTNSDNFKFNDVDFDNLNNKDSFNDCIFDLFNEDYYSNINTEYGIFKINSNWNIKKTDFSKCPTSITVYLDE